MSRVNFRSSDLQRIADTSRVLLMPDPEDGPPWPVAVNQVLKRLVDADLATFTIEQRERHEAITDDIDPRLMKRYFAEWAQAERIGQLDAIVLALGVSSRRMAWGQRAPDLYRTEYYNGVVVPARAFDSLTMAVPLPGGGAAKAFVHHGAPTGPKFGRRGLALLQAVYPAFVAGVRAFIVGINQAAALGTFLDALPQATLLFSAAGALLHANRAACGLLASDCESACIEAAVETVKQALLPLAQERTLPGLASPPVADARTLLARYRVTGCLAPAGILTTSPAIRITVDCNRPPLPAAALIVERATLTPTEARVALLLAERKTNNEIAQALSISRHTAHHHTENVLLKLGVHSRRDAAAAVQSLA